MLVYRFEHKDHGIGPFAVLGSRWFRRPGWGMSHVLACPGDYPEPYADCIPSRSDADNIPYYFGCRTLADLLSWFTRPRFLFLAGFRLYVYDCPDDCIWVGQSGKQVAFDRGQADIVAEASSCDEIEDLRNLEATYAEAA